MIKRSKAGGITWPDFKLYYNIYGTQRLSNMLWLLSGIQIPLWGISIHAALDGCFLIILLHSVLTPTLGTKLLHWSFPEGQWNHSCVPYNSAAVFLLSNVTEEPRVRICGHIVVMPVLFIRWYLLGIYIMPASMLKALSHLNLKTTYITVASGIIIFR